MKDQKKAKWILGTSGVIFSALLLTQFSNEVESESITNQENLSNEQTANMTEREKELVQLDWTNFEIVGVTQQQQTKTSERKTRRS